MSTSCHLSCTARSNLRSRPSPRCPPVCSASPTTSHRSSSFLDLSRRQSLVATLSEAVILGASLSFPNIAAAEKLQGFNPVLDKGDNYRFLYPFGWQEVDVEGQDVVYKDLIEPLESVSVTITPTERSNIAEFGPVDKVCFALADTVLTPPSQQVKLLGSESKEVAGIEYYVFEFAANAKTYIRKAVSVVTVHDGKFYTLTTGANERRWPKVEEKLKTVVKSFQVGVFAGV